MLFVGLALVLGGILWLRLHPFLALIAGALAVSSLTSTDQLVTAMSAKYRGELVRTNEPSESESTLTQQAQTKAEQFAERHWAIKRVTLSMGDTCEKIGLLIAMACVVGRCLLATGAAERIVRAGLSLFGERCAPLAFSASSFVLGIPVFFDSVFLLTIPLAKATWLKLRKNYLLFTLALITGGTMTHSLVPPTPGPLFVAKELGVNVGLMILVGLAVGLCCTAVGLGFAYWLNGRIDIPMRETPEGIERLRELSSRDLGQLPPLWVALAPVLLPVVLISGATVFESMLDPSQELPWVIKGLGDSNVALSIAAVIAMLTAAVYMKDRNQFVDQLQQAMQEAGLIILICCGGGAFGASLQQTAIGPTISSWMGSQPLDFGLLPMAFVVTAVIRTAQGSSTVAMLTGVEIVRSLAPDLDALSYHPVYLAVSIGCGSKLVPWMNDSGFWVISQMSGMTAKETLKTQSPMVSLMGIVGIAVTMIGAALWPLE